MTREEASNILDDYDVNFEGHTAEEVAEAFDVAFRALEQEPCEDCRNCKKWSDCECGEKGHINGTSIGYSIGECKDYEPKTGHWILQPSNKEQGERDFIWWKCSECGQVIYSETPHDRLEFHAFCGRCGARMIEPQESEDKE